MDKRTHTSKSILIIFFLFSFLFLSADLNAQLTAWRFEIPVTITNGSSSTITDYQVQIILNTQALISAGYMKNDGGDIRFASDCGTTVVDHYLQGYINTDTTRLWIKIASLAPNASTVRYLYFGNPAATSNSTLSIFSGPHSATDSVVVASTNTVSLCQRGFRFTPITNILVTHFGKRIPNATQRYVTLFDFNSQAIIAQIQVDAGTVGNYNYNPLPNAIWLNNGQQYVIELFNGASDMYYYGTSSQIGQHLTYGDMRYQNTCTQNTFPTNTLTNYHYGCPDFWYYVRTTPVTPEPTAAAGSIADTNTPATPLNLQGIAGNQQAYLSWRKNTDLDVGKYFIYRHTANVPGSSTLIDSITHPDTMYTATGLTNGATYYFWVRAVDKYCIRRFSGYSNVATVTPVSVPNPEIVPKVYALYQNYPNPFNPVTDIRYDIPKESFVRLVIYDLIGREIAVLVNGIQKPGQYSAKWGSENIPSGAYIYKMTAGDYEKTMKMVLLK